ncbi:MAG: hypothetical protein ACKPCP_19355 [Sphaerospermopsis kisseleviana]
MVLVNLQEAKKKILQQLKLKYPPKNSDLRFTARVKDNRLTVVVISDEVFEKALAFDIEKCESLKSDFGDAFYQDAVNRLNKKEELQLVGRANAALLKVIERTIVEQGNHESESDIYTDYYRCNFFYYVSVRKASKTA